MLKSKHNFIDKEDIINKSIEERMLLKLKHNQEDDIINKDLELINSGSHRTEEFVFEQSQVMVFTTFSPNTNTSVIDNNDEDDGLLQALSLLNVNKEQEFTFDLSKEAILDVNSSFLEVEGFLRHSKALWKSTQELVKDEIASSKAVTKVMRDENSDVSNKIQEFLDWESCFGFVLIGGVCVFITYKSGLLNVFKPDGVESVQMLIDASISGTNEVSRDLVLGSMREVLPRLAKGFLKRQLFKGITAGLVSVATSGMLNCAMITFNQFI